MISVDVGSVGQLKFLMNITMVTEINMSMPILDNESYEIALGLVAAGLGRRKLFMACPLMINWYYWQYHYSWHGNGD
jgi:hypothetical protein